MSNLSIFHGPNAGYILELFEEYKKDPNSVDPATRVLFAQWTPDPEEAPETPQTVTVNYDVAKVVRAARAARLVRELGHMAAKIDPLGSEREGDPDLLLETHGITEADLAVLPAVVIDGPLAEGKTNALEALRDLRDAYMGAIGYEDDHIQLEPERRWLRAAAEGRTFFQGITDDLKRQVLERLTAVEGFERYLHTTFVGTKRFSIEGCDMLVPVLDTILSEAKLKGVKDVTMGMAHRGRLNVLVHILHKPYSKLIAEFQRATDTKAAAEDDHPEGWTGDVKYHLGWTTDYDGMKVSLAPNPSHLEFVNPAVIGGARALQERRTEVGPVVQDPSASLCVTIHGDAAFPGQGIVAETLNLGRLPGYSIGGTIHIIANNQIGFTTDPDDGRSTMYASDLAKGYEIPIVHVNADDPVACIAAARMAIAYRNEFKKDFLIDLVGYRRFGHNETDEPAFTQPQMYQIIRNMPTVREKWATRLVNDGVVTAEEASGMVAEVKQVLQDARAAGYDLTTHTSEDVHVKLETIQTGVNEAELLAYNEELLKRPDGFVPNAKLDGILQKRREDVHKPGGILWGHGESLALASILADGTPIRFTGQDCERGTFGHRNLMLHHAEKNAQFAPLKALSQAKASFSLYNSPLSENAAMGFEYGYSIYAPESLVIWEAQFGDFGNSAQVIIDQFLVSGYAKWEQSSSLVLLLPHGYEGAGPEHSSARLERYLQLAAHSNIFVVNCTNVAQYFHLLRRQAALLGTAPRPLVVMTPKSLLRHPRAACSLEDLTEGTFQTVLDDSRLEDRRDKVTRLILCSGKVYVDLVTNREFEQVDRLAVARLEQLYPFPEAELQAVLSGYKNLKEVVWLQEEPRNMGAWSFVSPLIGSMLPKGVDFRYIGRPESASTAEGSQALHELEQVRILSAALSAVPELKSRRSAVHAR